MIYKLDSIHFSFTLPVDDFKSIIYLLGHINLFNQFLVGYLIWIYLDCSVIENKRIEIWKAMYIHFLSVTGNGFHFRRSHIHILQVFLGPIHDKKKRKHVHM